MMHRAAWVRFDHERGFIMIVDMNDKKTERQLRDVALLQEFDAIPDKLTDMIGTDSDELDLDTMDMVVAASSAPAPDFERFKSYVKKHQ